MKKILLPLIIAIAFAGTAIAQKKPAPAKGKTTPPPAAAVQETGPKSLAIGADIPAEGVMLMATDGQIMSLPQAKTDKGLLVMFSCNTCPYVVKAQSRTKEAIEFAKKLGVGMVILNSNEAQRASDDSPEAMRMYAKMHDYSVPYLRDDVSQVANAFGATRTPEVFLFNGKGKLVYKGALEDNPAEPAKSKVQYLSAAMRAMTDGLPINPAETKSIGCSIKRTN